MSDKLYVSKQNYYPGNRVLLAGTVFTRAQWIEAGGTLDGLDVHVSRGYITETVNEAPEAIVVEEAPSVEEAPAKEEEAPVDAPEAPTGVWNFTAEELEPLPLKALNAMYKDRAKEFGQTVSRAFTSKKSIIKKMTSEA